MATIKLLTLEVLELREENARLRKALRENGRHAKRIQRAHKTALLLARWHTSYQPTSRKHAKANGIPQRQWDNAVALLRLARVCDRSGRWKYHDLTDISVRLDGAVDAANAAPEAYFAKGNQHMLS